MPAQLVLVHDEIDVAADFRDVLISAGLDVVLLDGSMAAIQALDRSAQIELLITKVDFAKPPHGVALARMARHKRPNVQVLFLGDADEQHHTTGLAEFLARPTSATELEDKVLRLLTRDRCPPV